MNRWERAARGIIASTSVALVVLAGAGAASAQHVTPAMAVAMMGTKGPDATGCEDRARQAAKTLDALNANLERARLTNSESAMREAVDALQKGFTDLTARLGACRAVAARQQSESIVECSGDLLQLHHARPGGGEFYRQRDAVQPVTDVRDDGKVVGVRRKVRPGVRRPFHE